MTAVAGMVVPTTGATAVAGVVVVATTGMPTVIGMVIPTTGMPAMVGMVIPTTGMPAMVGVAASAAVSAVVIPAAMATVPAMATGAGTVAGVPTVGVVAVPGGQQHAVTGMVPVVAVIIVVTVGVVVFRMLTGGVSRVAGVLVPRRGVGGMVLPGVLGTGMVGMVVVVAVGWVVVAGKRYLGPDHRGDLLGGRVEQLPRPERGDRDECDAAHRYGNLPGNSHRFVPRGVIRRRAAQRMRHRTPAVLPD